MKHSFHAALIAGTHSSVGKTTWSLGLMAFFRKQGYEVQPFKVGPDYIDPGFHHLICSPRKSRNLDRFFLSETYLKECFQENSAGADLAFVEGVMGLFDGRSAVSEEGSSAEMAKLLGLPVFLVIDGAGLARSAAALVKGYQSFDPKLSLRGVLLNRVGSEGHFKWLKESIEKETGVPVLGWLPSEPEVSIPERHLGLRTAGEEEGIQKKLSQLTRLLEGRFDERRFLELLRPVIASPPTRLRVRHTSSSAAEPRSREAGEAISESGLLRPCHRHRRCQGRLKESLLVLTPAASGLRRPALPGGTPRNDKKTCRIGVAYDQAFSFYYEDNFDLLREAGAELVFFSPLRDQELPEGLDALYIGGGFPELHVRKLSANQSMKASIRKFFEVGGVLYGECGGLIYLAESLVDANGDEFPLVGLIPGKIRMTGRLQHFGYHEIEALTTTFLFPAGQRLRSHEFHYSTWEAPSKNFSRSYQIADRRDGFYEDRLLASYQHLHFGQDGELARNFVRALAEKSIQM